MEPKPNPNTPWAHPGPERIQVARGKVPLRALKDGEVRRLGSLVLSSGALLKVFQNQKNNNRIFSEHFPPILHKIPIENTEQY